MQPHRKVIRQSTRAIINARIATLQAVHVKPSVDFAFREYAPLSDVKSKDNFDVSNVINDK